MFISDTWVLTLATFLPLVGAVIVMALPKAEEQAIKFVALGTSLLVAAIGVMLLIDFNYGAAGDLQYVVDESWIDIINSRYIMGMDGISFPLILLTMLVVPLTIVYTFGHFPEPHNPKAFLSLMLILETGMIGTFVAQDLILFFVFFEVVLLPMYFMIGVWGGEDRKYASLKFFLYTLFGSALMLVSFVALYFLADGELAGVTTNTFDMRALPPALFVGAAKLAFLYGIRRRLDTLLGIPYPRLEVFDFLPLFLDNQPHLLRGGDIRRRKRRLRQHHRCHGHAGQCLCLH